jgi:hypothetical protein
VQRARDRAELKLELQQPVFSRSDPHDRATYIAEEYPDLVRVCGKIRCETIYPEGGRCTEWITDGEDSEKENFDPSSSSSGRLSSPFNLGSSSSSSLPRPSSPFNLGSSSSSSLPHPSQPAAVSVANLQQPANPAFNLGAFAVDASPSDVPK